MSAASLPEYYPFRSPEARDRFLAHYDAAAESWPVPSERLLVDTDAGRTCVWVSGSDGAPPLVLLPGAWAHALMWPPSLVEMLSVHFRTYAVDNICDVGRSVSSRPLRTADEFSGWLDGLFDALDLVDGVNLMGISRGGWLAGEYALHAPGRLGRVVLLSPGLVVIGTSARSFAAAPYSVGSIIAPSDFTVGGLMRRLMPYYRRSDPRAFERYVTETATALKCFDTGKVCGFVGPRVFSDDELRGVKVPVLYMAGEDEIMSSAAAAVRRLHAVAPAFETTVVPDAGHDLVEVHTEVVGNRVLAFLMADEDSPSPRVEPEARVT